MGRKKVDLKLPTKAVPVLFPSELPAVILGSLLVLLFMLGTGATMRVALYRRLLKPERYSPSAADLWVLGLRNAGDPGYFLDIGAFGSSNASNTRILEENGWR